MAVVSIAITVSFHLKNEPSPLELRMAKPLGTIFWALSVMTLFAGVGNYISKSMAFSVLLDYRNAEARPRGRKMHSDGIYSNGEPVQQESSHRADRMEDARGKFSGLSGPAGQMLPGFRLTQKPDFNNHGNVYHRNMYRTSSHRQGSRRQLIMRYVTCNSIHSKSLAPEPPVPIKMQISSCK